MIRVTSEYSTKSDASFHLCMQSIEFCVCSMQVHHIVAQVASHTSLHAVVTMAVTIETCYAISCGDSKPWRVTSDMVKNVHDEVYVKIVPYDQALVRLVVDDALT